MTAMPEFLGVPLSQAEYDALHERRRQVHGEGWTHEHDDHHRDGSLALVAALYASPTPLHIVTVAANAVAWLDPWPWFHWGWAGREQGDDPPARKVLDWDGRNKHDRRRQLVISAALVLAEIERMDRAAGKASA